MADDFLNVDLDSLRISEIELIEDIIDMPIDTALAGNVRKGKILRAIGYVVKRRDNPAFTLEDAGNLIVKLNDEPDPTTAAG